LVSSDVPADLGFAFELADLAASISVERFRQRRYSIETKVDGSPVTDVDVLVEQALRERIGRAHGDHMVIGEETGQSGHSDWCWYLDPVDGTTRFVGGDPKWMTLIALAHRGEIMLGVVDYPALGERWWASRGYGAFHDGQPISVSNTSRLSDATINDDWREHIARGHRDHPLAVVATHCARVRRHQGHGSLAVACGQADIAISTGSHPWDYAPLKVIVEEAGGAHTDFEGGPRLDTGQAVVTNGVLHEQVLRALPVSARERS
jgi:histidinol-phosphatase